MSISVFMQRGLLIPIPLFFLSQVIYKLAYCMLILLILIFFSWKCVSNLHIFTYLIVAVLLLFMILNSHQMSPNFLVIFWYLTEYVKCNMFLVFLVGDAEVWAVLLAMLLGLVLGM